MIPESEAMTRYRQRLAIVTALRGAFATVKTHATLTKRARPAIDAALSGYSVHFNPARKYPFDGSGEIEVWGNGIDYKDRFFVLWYLKRNGEAVAWQDAVAYALDREDPSDIIERLAAEERLAAKLAKLDRDVAAIREKALAMIRALPVPASSTLRAESSFWDAPQSETVKTFPHLFGRIES